MDLTVDRRLWTKLRSSGGWFTRAWDLGQSMRTSSVVGNDLFVVGTPTFDPWHVTAHLDLQARNGALSGPRPTLLRWQPPQEGPAHLRHGVDELAESPGKPIFVVAPDGLGETELERLADARRRGSTLFAVSGGQDELNDLSHEYVTVTGDDFEVATHLVSIGAGAEARTLRRISAFTH